MKATLHKVSRDSLADVNRVIERAVDTWRISDRIKRLILPTCQYDEHDLAFQTLVLARDSKGTVIAVAAWEDTPCPLSNPDNKALLLQGLYVDPDAHRQGIGAQLVDACLAAARRTGRSGILVRAKGDAEGFFLSRGMRRLPVTDPDREYGARFWLGA